MQQSRIDEAVFEIREAETLAELNSYYSEIVESDPELAESAQVAEAIHARAEALEKNGGAPISGEGIEARAGGLPTPDSLSPNHETGTEMPGSGTSNTESGTSDPEPDQNAPEPEQPEPIDEAKAARIAQLQAELASLVGTPVPPVPSPTNPATTATATQQPKPTKQYRLLKSEVKWATKPQIHAIMSALTASINVGDVVGEDAILELVEAAKRAGVLRTRQKSRRIWDYYKGDHSEGLTAHGVIEQVFG